MLIERGDVIIITKPNNVTSGTGWCKDMDKFVGQQKVRAVLCNGDFYIESSPDYLFASEWCQKV